MRGAAADADASTPHSNPLREPAVGRAGCPQPAIGYPHATEPRRRARSDAPYPHAWLTDTNRRCGSTGSAHNACPFAPGGEVVFWENERAFRPHLHAMLKSLK